MNNDKLLAALGAHLNKGEFSPWPKTPRVGKREPWITITEKMDGTNACIVIEGGEIVGIQSRNRFIAPGDDNFGFAKWVAENADELVKLGHGKHYGEWTGPGIQKNPHGLSEKAFYLFNTDRPVETLPDCVKQVRVLYHGPRYGAAVEEAMLTLSEYAAERGYTPEGVVVFDRTTKTREKATFAYSQGKWGAA